MPAGSPVALTTGPDARVDRSAISEKMGAKLAIEQLNRSIVIEGTLHIQSKTNPDIMVEFLNAYLPENQRVVEEAA